MWKTRIIRAALACLIGASCVGCSSELDYQAADVHPLVVEIDDEAVPLGSAEAEEAIADGIKQEATELPAEAALPVPTAVPSGEKVKSTNVAEIDYSNIGDGYVMVRYTGETDKKLKAQVKGPSVTYTYHLEPGEWEAFPLSDGNGTYRVRIYRNVKDNKYASVLSVTTDVELKDEFAPFLHSNQYVDFDAAPNAIAKAEELCAETEDVLEAVAAVYGFVVEGMTYDTELAKSVKSGYLPVLDTVLDKMTGICFDYAALMTGMLRSQDIPCKLVVGYAGEVYHAWISVYSEETGWIDGAVYFDGTAWKRMDPTFASSGKGSKSILDFIKNDKNYTVKYLY